MKKLILSRYKIDNFIISDLLRNNRLIFLPSSLCGHPSLEVVLLDNNLLTDLPNFLFNLPALKVVSFSGNLLLPEQRQTKPVFSPNEECLKEIIETVKITESSGCNEHQGVSQSPYEEIAVNDRNHIQPLKGFQSCSRCVSDFFYRNI